MAATVAAQGLRAGRRRTALNEALHELRRPLQAVALASGPGVAAAGGDEARSSWRRRRWNGSTARSTADRIRAGQGATVDCRVAGPVGGRPLAGAGEPRRRLAELRWSAGQGDRRGRPVALGAGARQPDRQRDRARRAAIVVEARRLRGRLRIAVVDSGRFSRPAVAPRHSGRDDRAALRSPPPRSRPRRGAPGGRGARRPLRPAALGARHARGARAAAGGGAE